MSFSQRFRKYVRDLETFPRDAVLAWRRGGLGELWETVADRSVYRLVRTGRLWVIAQALDHCREVEPPAGITIRQATGRDWDALGAIALQRDLDRFRRLAEAGRVCLIAWRNGQPVGYTWYADGLGPDVTQLPLALPASAAYLWDLYVVPAERSSGIGSALVSARLRLARERGFREGWRMIAPSNRPSLRTMEKTGDSRIVGEIRFVKLLSRIFSRYRPWPQTAISR